jgi:hypothetical protein
VLLDGLRVQLVTTPQHTSEGWALALLDDNLTALAGRSTQRSRTCYLSDSGPGTHVCGAAWWINSTLSNRRLTRVQRFRPAP